MVSSIEPEQTYFGVWRSGRARGTYVQRRNGGGVRLNGDEFDEYIPGYVCYLIWLYFRTKVLKRQIERHYRHIYAGVDDVCVREDCIAVCAKG